MNTNTNTTDTDRELIDGLMYGVDSGDYMLFDPADPEAAAAVGELRDELADGDDQIDLDTVDTTPAAAELPSNGNPFHARNIEAGWAATQKQIDLITKLSQERDITTPDSVGLRAVVRGREFWKAGLLGKVQASGVIDDLLVAGRNLPHPGPGAAPVDSAHAHEIAEAARIAEASKPEANTVHMLGGEVYRVVESRNGRLYAQKLDGTRWGYAAGVIRRLSADTVMTAEQAADYGQAFGVCAVCGKLLTNETSIERGIGPVCFSRLH